MQGCIRDLDLTVMAAGAHPVYVTEHVSMAANVIGYCETGDLFHATVQG